MHMKRTTLVLDEEALEAARTITGSRTYSETVNFALRELVGRRNFATIDRYTSSGIWDGDLSEMRDDGRLSR